MTDLEIILGCARLQDFYNRFVTFLVSFLNNFDKYSKGCLKKLKPLRCYHTFANKYSFIVKVLLRGKGLRGNPILFGGGNFRTRFVGRLVVALVISIRTHKSGESFLLVLLQIGMVLGEGVFMLRDMCRVDADGFCW